MRAMASESYAFLITNLPAWLGRLQLVGKKARVVREASQEIYTPTAAGVGFDVRESLHPSDKHVTNVPVRSARTPASPSRLEPSDSVRQQRPTLLNRFKTSSLLSGHIPKKTRSKSKPVVYYDSEIQETFATVVRDIGAARNTLRKSKMAARHQAVATRSQESKRVAEAGQGSDDDDIGISKEAAFKSRRLSSRTVRASPGHVMGDPSNESDSFDAVDNALKRAQSLSEEAAYRYLREGECEDELDGIGQELHAAFVITQSEIESGRLKRIEDLLQHRPVSEHEVLAGGPSEEPKGDAPSKARVQHLNSNDDDEDDDLGMPLGALRLTSRNMRGQLRVSSR